MSEQPSSKDIVSALRRDAGDFPAGRCMRDAADEIERLQALLGRIGISYCNTHGTEWQSGCKGCSEAQRLTVEPKSAPTVSGYTTDDDLLNIAYGYGAGSQFTAPALLKMLRHFESAWRRPSQPPRACEHGAHPPTNCAICTRQPPCGEVSLPLDDLARIHEWMVAMEGDSDDEGSREWRSLKQDIQARLGPTKREGRS